jgi:integrase/recombinase XerD
MLQPSLRLRAARLGVPVAELTGPLFATLPYRGRPGGGPLGNDYLQDVLRRWARAAGLGNAEELVMHSLRHTAATLLSTEVDINRLREFLDHSDIATTQVYVHSDTSLNNSPAYLLATLIDDDGVTNDPASGHP